MVAPHHSQILENSGKNVPLWWVGPRERAKTTGFPGSSAQCQKRGYTPLPKMRKPLEKGTWLWFLTPEMTRIFAEII